MVDKPKPHPGNQIELQNRNVLPHQEQLRKRDEEELEHNKKVEKGDKQRRKQLKEQEEKKIKARRKKDLQATRRRDQEKQQMREIVWSILYAEVFDPILEWTLFKTDKDGIRTPRLLTRVLGRALGILLTALFALVGAGCVALSVLFPPAMIVTVPLALISFGCAWNMLLKVFGSFNWKTGKQKYRKAEEEIDLPVLDTDGTAENRPKPQDNLKLDVEDLKEKKEGNEVGLGPAELVSPSPVPESGPEIGIVPEDQRDPEIGIVPEDQRDPEIEIVPEDEPEDPGIEGEEETGEEKIILEHGEAVVPEGETSIVENDGGYAESVSDRYNALSSAELKEKFDDLRKEYLSCNSDSSDTEQQKRMTEIETEMKAIGAARKRKNGVGGEQEQQSLGMSSRT